MKIPVSTASWLPVLIQQRVDGITPVTDIAYDAAGLSVSYSSEGGEAATKTLTAANWKEHGAGVYKIQFTAEELANLGTFFYTVEYTGARNYPGAVRIYTPLMGEGSVTWVYPVTEYGTGDPIADVEVWLTTDADGGQMHAGPQRSTPAGTVTWRTDPGTYYVWCQKGGYNFTNPDIETVT